LLIAALAGCSASSGLPSQGGVEVQRLDAAVAGLSAARRPLLADVDAVQAAATALDEVDAVCATGDGVKARTAYRAARPKVLAAQQALSDLAAGVGRYEQALSTLSAEVDAGSAAVRKALTAVVRDGRKEASALGSFRTSVGLLWPSYDLLVSQEQTWITRAVTPWYRTASEGASAYAILTSHGRSQLTDARESLATAAHVLAGPSAVQSATLQAADQVLAQQRTSG
jgi:hypothetical protein